MAAGLACALSQVPARADQLDRTVLPIPQSAVEPMTEPDVRKALMPHQDQLAGLYHQPLLGQAFEVVFKRLRP